MALHTSGFHVIVAETGPLWQDLVQEVGELPDAPPVVLMSRVADERLWAEVLNLGAFDLLMKPLNPAEVRWVLEAATRQHERRDVAAAGLQPRFGQNFHV